MRIAAAALLALVAFLAVMILSQDQLLFPTQAVPSSGPLPANSDRIELKTPDDNILHGVHLRPAVDDNGPKLLLVGFGGNAWNGQHVAEYLRDVFPEAHVIAFHYRGYRPSTGSPSAKALLDDAPLVLRASTERVKPDLAVAIGFSIGSGVAASLARQPGVDGLVLVTPFDSLKAVAGQLYPWLPVGPFFRHEIDTAAHLKDSRLPVAIISAAEDEVIPAARTDALRPRVPNLVFDRAIGRAGHNDIYGRKEFREALHEAAKAVASK